jgi:four helix bundle protein
MTRKRARAREPARKASDMFDHERLEVYRAAIELVAIADEIAGQLPRGRGKLADQLSRASISLPLNIAEGAGRYGQKEKQHSYRIARGSAMECAAIVDVCLKLDLISDERSRTSKELLVRIVSMLTRLIQSLE